MAKNVLPKHWNGSEFEELHIVTKASNVFTNDNKSVQQKIDDFTSHLADTARFINVKKYGAKGNGIDDDTNSINLAISDMTDGAILYFPKGTYIISSTLLIPYNNITIKGEYSYVKFPNGMDGVVFEFNNQININIDGVGSSNTTSAQTFIKATSTHHLHVTNANFDGMKLGFDLTDCYWTKLESLRFQSIYKCFEFKSATNAFHIANVSINGAGVPSTIYMCTSGGNITGCSFEGKSGRIKINIANGINIDGNYFEGYDEVNINEYISIGDANYKDTTGINISGNLFYTGSKNGITLYNVDGINISGNYFGTTHAVELYSYDASNQSNISYTGNSYSGSTEFLITGLQNQASVSPEYKFPLIFKPSLLNPKTLGTNEIAIYNDSGLMKLKKESGVGNIVSSETIFNSTLDTNTSITKNIDNGLGTFLLFVTTFINNSTQKTGAYIIQGNINLGDHFYVIPLSNNDLVEVTATIDKKTITIKNIDTVSRFINVKLVEFS